MRQRASNSFLLSVVLVMMASQAKRAEAQGAAGAKAWEIAKSVLPQDINILAGIQIPKIKQSALFSSFYPQLMASDPKVKDGFDRIKNACSLDVTQAIEQILVAVDSKEKSAVFLSTKGVDEKKATSCLIAVAKTMEGQSVTAKRTGTIIEYSSQKETDKLYTAWPSENVMVLTTEPTDKALLESFIKGKGTIQKNDFYAKNIKGLNTSAAMWVLVAKEEPMLAADQSGKPAVNMKGAYGSIDLANGLWSIEFNMVLDSAAGASAMVADINKSMAQQQAALPPAMAAIFKSLKVSAQGNNMLMKLNIADKDALALVQLLMSAGGGMGLPGGGSSPTPPTTQGPGSNTP